MLGFNRSMSPHTGEAACEFIVEVIRDWGLTKRISSVTKENASDMFKEIKLLHMNLLMESPGIYSDAAFLVRFVAHIIHLAVKECMKIIQSRI